MSPDWVSLKIEFVNGAMQYKELAAKHGLKEATVRQRANREGWMEERHKLSHAVTEAANRSLGDERAKRLAEFNDKDIKIANALKAKAAALLRGEMTAPELRALAGVFDSAQKIGRLALGAETEVSTVNTRELPASVDDFV